MPSQTNLNLSTQPTGPIECLGQTFPSEATRREHYLELLAEKLKDPEFRKIEGFPIGEDEDILALSDPPYYTACPNPWIGDFIKHYGRPYDPKEKYHREPFAADVSEGKNHPIYNAHSYHTKVPHRAIMRYILHYTEPGDVVFDGFCGTGMTGVAAQLCGDRNEVQELGYKVDSAGSVFGDSRALVGPMSNALYLRHALVEPGELEPLRAEAIHLFQASGDPEKDRVLSWGLASACYPFLQEVATTIGRMLRVQPELKLEQLLRKLTESFGEKETVRRSGRYSLGLIQDLGFVHRTKKAGCYSACQPTKLTDPGLASWIIRAWFYAAGTASPMDRIALSNHPSLSFFDAPELVATALKQGVLTMDRLSLSQDMVTIVG